MHRNSQKRVEVDEAIFAITTVTNKRYEYFANEILCDLFIEELRLCKAMKRFYLYSFCLMPDHLHWVIHPHEWETISGIMHFLKRNFSRDANIVMNYSPLSPGEDMILAFQNSEDMILAFQNSEISGGGVPQPRRGDHERILREQFKPYTETVLNFDRIVSHYRSRWFQKYGNSSPLPKFQWQPSFHDHIVRDEEDLANQILYCNRNPEKDGLIDDYTKWKYGSFGFPELVDEVVM